MNQGNHANGIGTAQTDGTRTMVWGIGLAALTFAVGRVAGIIAGKVGLDATFTAIVVRAILVVAFIFWMGGGSWLRISAGDIRRTWRYVRPFIIINILLGGLTCISVILLTIAGEMSLEGTLYWGTYTTLLCILVGINEEGMFRGLFLGGLLAKLGDKKDGILRAAIISSAAFGFLHVIFDMDYGNIYSIGMGLMKTLECGMFAFAFCVPVIQDKSLWGAITAHAFFDWIMLFGNTIANGGMTAPTYVSSDPTIAMYGMGLYAIMALLYLPKTIQSVRELRSMEMPQYGPFRSCE